MVRGTFIGIMILLIWAGTSGQEVSKTSAELIQDSIDSTEYKLIIIDLYFYTWYLLHFDPSKDHSIEYYQAKNLIAVAHWNDYYRRGQYMDVVDSYIDYQPGIDYGIELNRKLFWYFKYVNTEYKIQLYL